MAVQKTFRTHLINTYDLKGLGSSPHSAFNHSQVPSSLRTLVSSFIEWADVRCPRFLTRILPHSRCLEVCPTKPSLALHPSTVEKLLWFFHNFSRSYSPFWNKSHPNSSASLGNWVAYRCIRTVCVCITLSPSLVLPEHRRWNTHNFMRSYFHFLLMLQLGLKNGFFF